MRRISFGARTYNASIGRFDGVDPLGEKPEQIDKSPYAYAWNNPVKNTDPDGKCPNCFTALGGALLKGGIELGSQLLSGKSLNEVDWADVGVETVKGAIIGSGVGAVASGIMEVGGVAVKANLDISKKDGVKTTINGSKSVGEATFDATADVVAGKVSGKIGGTITSGLEKSAKKLTAEATTANRASSIAKSYATETNKQGAKTLATNLGKEATVVTVKQKVVSTTAQVSKSSVGEVVKTTYQNKFTDAVKKLFGY